MANLEVARRVAAQFDLPTQPEVEDFQGKGNINLDALLVTSGEKRYLLQRINHDVFAMPHRLMESMIRALDCQRAAIEIGHPKAPDWRVPDLIATREGSHWVEEGGVWRMMGYVEGTYSRKSLNDFPDEIRLDAAREVGRGLAVYSDMTQDVEAAQILPSLPGYRDTRLYFRQLHAALEGCRTLEEVELPDDPEVRASAEPHFVVALTPEDWRQRRNDAELAPLIALALAHEAQAVRLQELRETGEIRQTAIHGDTKIENFLFDTETNRVVSLVDLDTIMAHSWLADWGDMVRSLVNVAGEKETDLGKVKVDREVYAAVLEGFLQAATSPTPAEIALMPKAVQCIALELGIRFLADYLRGDTYFALSEKDPRDLNRTRAMVQLTLFKELLAHESEADALVARFRR